MEKINQFDPVAIVQIPSNIVVNTPIRLRISSDEVGNIMDQQTMLTVDKLKIMQ